MFGYPGVAGLNSVGEQVAQAVRPVGGPALPSVVLDTMQFASAEVSTDDNPVGTNPCLDIPALLVTPPDDRYSVRVGIGTQRNPADIRACQPLTVGPVVVGVAAP
jgi:hypothetical protein